LDYELHYIGFPVVLEGYNASYKISNTKNSKSTNGYNFTLGETTISWKSSKQTCIAISMMALEFISLDKVIEEAEWL